MISDFFAAHYRLFAKLYSLTFLAENLPVWDAFATASSLLANAACPFSRAMSCGSCPCLFFRTERSCRSGHCRRVSQNSVRLNLAPKCNKVGQVDTSGTENLSLLVLIYDNFIGFCSFYLITDDNNSIFCFCCFFVSNDLNVWFNFIESNWMLSF